MIWAVIHRGSDGNKQNNSLPCALEEALPLHWLFKCSHFVSVCFYTLYILHIFCVSVSALILNIHNSLLLQIIPWAVLAIPAK